jgi:transcriptional regulator with XRE-family HTH domain
MNQLRRQFAQRLKELRQQKGLTQQELAETTGLSTSFIRSIEQGVYAPSFESMETIAKRLDVKVKDLFDFGKD